jgi:hypothetical protein
MKKYTNINMLTATVGFLALAVSASATDLYRSGTGTWGAANTWGPTGGPYTSASWTDGDSAFLEDTQGTVTLDADFSADQITIGANIGSGGNLGAATNYVVTGNNTLTFTGTKTLTVNGVDASINSGIAGAPTLNYNNRPIGDLILNSGSLTQNYAAINVVKGVFGDQGNAVLTLDGTSIGNSTGAIAWSNFGQGHQLNIEKAGSGTWEIGSFSGGDSRLHTTGGAGGTLIINGTVITSHQIDINKGHFVGAGTLGVTRGGSDHVQLYAGATMAPGTTGVGSMGTLTIQNDDFGWASDDATSGMLFDLSALNNTSDLLDITGSGGDQGGFNKDDGTSFLFDFTGGKVGETYTLVNFENTDFLVGDFAVGSGIDGTFTLNSNNLQFNAIPEPSTFALLGLGGLALILRRRK